MNKYNCKEYPGNFKDAFQSFASSSVIAGELIDYAQNFTQYSNCLNQKALTEKAYDIEAKTRMLLHNAMGSLNTSYDLGMMERALTELNRQASKDKKELFGEEIISQAAGYFKEHHPEIDTTFFDKAAAMIRKNKISIETGKENELIVHSIDENGKQQKNHLSIKKVPLSTGRVSKAEFFGKGSFSVFPGAESLFNDENCHHRPIVSVAEIAHSHDAYERTVNTFLHLKESAYRHARLIDEFGVPHLKGDDPFSIVIAIIAIVGAALIIAGVVIEVGCSNGTWNGTVCNIGWGLIGLGVIFVAGAIMCGVSGCTILIGLLGATAAV